MDFEPKTKKKDSENALAARLAKRASRHLINKTDKDTFKPTMGLSFLGALGWNIPLPTFFGALLGKWMDKHYPYASVSWTLNFLLLGLMIGIFSAWLWLKREGIERSEREQKRREKLMAQLASADAEKADENETDEPDDDAGKEEDGF